MLLATASPTEDQMKDIDFLLTGGEMFALVVYGQLILENAKIYNIDKDTVDQIFDFIVRDFSKFALDLYHKPISTPEQMEHCLKLIRKPNVDTDRYNRVWEKVHALNGVYEMNQ